MEKLIFIGFALILLAALIYLGLSAIPSALRPTVSPTVTTTFPTRS
jgi:hypothetical protein